MAIGKRADAPFAAHAATAGEAPGAAPRHRDGKPGGKACRPGRKNWQTGREKRGIPSGFFISKLEMYIFRLEMYIFRLDFYISKLEMKNFRARGQLFPRRSKPFPSCRTVFPPRAACPPPRCGSKARPETARRADRAQEKRGRNGLSFRPRSKRPPGLLPLPAAAGSGHCSAPSRRTSSSIPCDAPLAMTCTGRALCVSTGLGSMRYTSASRGT